MAKRTKKNAHRFGDCEHVLKPGTAREAEDYDYLDNKPRILIDITCAKCGMSGSVQIADEDIMWE